MTSPSLSPSVFDVAASASTVGSSSSELTPSAIESSCTALGRLGMKEVRRLATIAGVSIKVNRDDKAALCLALATKFEMDKFETQVDALPLDMANLLTNEPRTRWRWQDKQKVFAEVRALGLWTPAISRKSVYANVTNVKLIYDPDKNKDTLNRSNQYYETHTLTLRTLAAFQRVASDLHLTYPKLSYLDINGPTNQLAALDARTLNNWRSGRSEFRQLRFFNIILQNSDQLSLPASVDSISFSISKELLETEREAASVNVSNWNVKDIVIRNMNQIDGRFSRQVESISLDGIPMAMRDIPWPEHSEQNGGELLYVELDNMHWNERDYPTWPDTVLMITLFATALPADFRQTRWPANLEELVVGNQAYDVAPLLLEVEEDAETVQRRADETAARRTEAQRLFQERAAAQNSERGRRAYRRAIEQAQAGDAATSALRPQCQNAESYITLEPFENGEDVVALLLPPPLSVEEQQDDGASGSQGRRRARDPPQQAGPCYTRANLLTSLSRQWVRHGGNNVVFFQTPTRELLSESAVERISTSRATVFQLVSLGFDDLHSNLLYGVEESSWA